MCKERCPLHGAVCESKHEPGLIPTKQHYHVARFPTRLDNYLCAWEDEPPEDDELQPTLGLWKPLPRFDEIPDGANV